MYCSVYNILYVVEMFWPDVSRHRQQNHGPLVLSASHTSTVAEQLSLVLGVLLSLPRTRQIVMQYITNQLDAVTHLISHTFSSPSLPAVSHFGFFIFVYKLHGGENQLHSRPIPNNFFPSPSHPHTPDFHPLLHILNPVPW